MTFRTVIKEVAIEQGVYATFMPKPLSGQPGSGMHTHMSLFEGDVNAFYEEGAQYQLSKVGRQFIAGLLRHANEISAVTNQFVNSYKRLWGGDEAPSFICWGHNNRSALVRVPLYKPSKGQSSRVEYRALDSAANPYLAYALMLAAGLKGIEEEYELPPEAEDNVWSLTDAERRALGYAPLPASLDHALEYMEESELVAETLGEQVFNYVLLNKRTRVAGVPHAGHALRAEEQPRDALTLDRRTMSTSERSSALTGLARLGFSDLARRGPPRASSRRPSA